MDLLSKMALVFVFIFIVVMGSMYSCSNSAYAGESAKHFAKIEKGFKWLDSNCEVVARNPAYQKDRYYWMTMIAMHNTITEEGEEWEEVPGFHDAIHHIEGKLKEARKACKDLAGNEPSA